MAITLVVETGAGLSNANTYATLAEAAAYAIARVNGATFAAACDAASTSVETAKACLITASNRLDVETWQGWKVSEAQRLAHPRSAMYDQYGRAVDSASVARWLKEATIELAMILYANAGALDANALAQFESVTVGPISLTTRGGEVTVTTLPPGVQRLIAPFVIYGADGGANVRLVRG